MPRRAAARVFCHPVSCSAREINSRSAFANEKLLIRLAVGLSDTLTVTVNITNTGQREGAEIVQLFLSDIVATVTPPVKSLKRFSKVPLTPGQNLTVKFELNRDDFEFIGRNNKPVVEPGEFKVSIGGLTETFAIQ